MQFVNEAYGSSESLSSSAATVAFKQQHQEEQQQQQQQQQHQAGATGRAESPSLSRAEKKLYESIMNKARRDSRESAGSPASFASEAASATAASYSATSARARERQQEEAASVVEAPHGGGAEEGDNDDDKEEEGAEVRSRRDSLKLLRQLRGMKGVRGEKRATFVQQELSEHLLALHEGISARDRHIAKLQQQVRMLLDERKKRLLAMGESVAGDLEGAAAAAAAKAKAKGKAGSALGAEQGGREQQQQQQQQERIDMLTSENARLAKMVRELRVDNVGLGFAGRSRGESKVAAAVEEEWI